MTFREERTPENADGKDIVLMERDFIVDNNRSIIVAFKRLKRRVRDITIALSYARRDSKVHKI